MIPDVETMDQMYETARLFGAAPTPALFDFRYVLPLGDVARYLSPDDDPRRYTAESLQALADRGWFTMSTGQDGTVGMHLYVPERIPIFRDLEAKGYTDNELRL